MVAAAVFWSFGGVLAKAIPFGGLSIAAVRGVVAGVTIGIYRRSFQFKSNPTTWLAAVALFLTTVLFLIATKLTSAANAILLQYTSLFFIILLNWRVDKQKLGLHDALALLGIGIGMILFFYPQLSRDALIGDGLALLAGLMFALVFYVNKQVNAAPLDSVLMGNLMSVVLIPLIFFDAQVTFDVMPWMLLLIMGIFQLGFGYIFFALGIEKISATQSNVIATLEPILNPIWVYIFLGEPLTWYALLGGLFVLSSIVFYNFRVGFNHE